MTNIYEVAKKANVSTATVSRVFSNHINVRKETKDKVLKTAKELNYTPSLVAASLRTKISGYVGFVIPNIDLPMFVNVIKGIDDYLYKVNYNMLITNIGNRIDRLETQLDNFSKRRKVDGIIYCPLGKPDEEIKIIRDLIDHTNIPVVFMDRILSELNLPYVINDNFSGAYQATKHLIESGHKKIAVVYSGPEIYTTKLRLEGFQSALRDEKIFIDKELYYPAEYFTVESGYKVAEKILNSRHKPTAIFCITDELAIGVLKYMREKHISIPDDYSLMGYDDIQFSAITNPSLTTVHQVKHKMGYEAAKLIIKEINRKSKSNKKNRTVSKVVLEPYLVQRESVKCVK